MKYAGNDLQLGDKLLCTKSEVDHWISGKMYELKLNNLGVLEVKDEDGDEAYSSYLLECLNKEWDLVEFELIKEENKMQEFKVGDLVEVLENKSLANKDKFNLFEKGDRAIVKEVNKYDVRIGEYGIANLISKKEIKKVETELTDYEEELVLRLAEKIKQKDNYIAELEELDFQVKDLETLLEDKQKEIDFEVKKLLTK
ncbi:hypothetical protein [Enterococcus phage vB_EfaP_Ef7.4]|uniref:Uncharacterized protein n=1 Tax=Enterococcus phage vB_EfaP_Ef7.4 TaxID=2546620 RepID=A0A4D6DUI9_9CAUD|nr:hypothetical protein H3T73_gp02 [Enterococcus phage vB_EfaP_Ef7.4]QBZ69576.1 hypothetical protein [Enterococcus phage vB_EfaP_Ef7.4]